LSKKQYNLPLGGRSRLSKTFFFSLSFSFLPYLIPESEDGKSGPDLSTLRTFRVLRPLKLVSGVPSELERNNFIC
jgi:hypothetical protein